MPYRILIPLFMITVLLSCQQDDPVVRIAVTTDVHGMIFPYDFISRKDSPNSLAHIHHYAEENRTSSDTAFFLLDNGDFLQGQPTVYYSNFEDTTGMHLASKVMNHMAYAAGTVGNHDIEAGPAVYNKIRKEFSFPWLAANAVDTRTGEPYFEPYTILKAGRRRIAVLGMITPGIPHWLPRNLWPGMEFHDMVETAQLWVPRILEKEKPDLLIGLFHSGTDASYGGATDAYLNDNAVLLVAEEVPGFDLIYAGHDHKVSIQEIINSAGDTVIVIDPGSHGRFAGEATITFDDNGGRSILARNVAMKGRAASQEFQGHFASEREIIESYLEDTITTLKENMLAGDALFGPSSMMSLIHQVQLDISGADLSFTSPLSLRARLEKGPLLVSDMFKLYRFENMLYSMQLTGKEIDGFLEHAAGIWFATMSGPGDPMLLYETDNPGRLMNRYYNFASAAGIDYTIDLRKESGERVEISTFSNGEPFYPDSTYQVAVNSYRGNGGGGHLTRGAGINADSLYARVSWSTDRDLRYYLMKHLAEQERLEPFVFQNWSCLPDSWIERAKAREISLIR